MAGVFRYKEGRRLFCSQVLESHMDRRLLVVSVVLALLVVSYAGHRLTLRQRPGGSPLEASPSAPQRIVSMAPSLTETLFALGLDSRLVGVTRYCKYPAEAQQKTEIGGFLDPNYEAIAALQPDLIVTFPEHSALRDKLANSSCAFLTVEHKTPEDILASIETLGRECGAKASAQGLVTEIRRRMKAISASIEKTQKPRTLIIVDRTLGTGKVDKAYIAGEDGYFSRLIALAGGTNAYAGNVPFPCVSAEGILSMDPEVVIEVITSLQERGIEEAAVLKDWGPLEDVTAVKTGRVHVLTESYASVPGPRFHLLLEKLARTIHPEADWKAP